MKVNEHPMFLRFTQLPPLAHRMCLGAIFYLLFVIDMKYFPSAADGP
jgi:hypothetical protein